jgi:hypothetical protein
MWGSDTATPPRAQCPLVFLSCYLTEIMCFRLNFNETVDYCGVGIKEPKEIFAEFKKNTEIFCITFVFRFITGILNVGAGILVFEPICKVLNWRPFFGT